MTTPQTIVRAALAAALVALAGVLMWVAVTQATGGRSAALPSFVIGLMPLVAVWLLFKRPVIGATLAVVAAVLGAGLAFVLNFCLCPMPPLPTEFVALYIVALVVLVLAVLELVLLGYAWLAIVLLLAGLALTGNPILIGAGVVIAGVIIWLLLRRRRSASPPPPPGGET